MPDHLPPARRSVACDRIADQPLPTRPDLLRRACVGCGAPVWVVPEHVGLGRLVCLPCMRACLARSPAAVRTVFVVTGRGTVPEHN